MNISVHMEPWTTCLIHSIVHSLTFTPPYYSMLFHNSLSWYFTGYGQGGKWPWCSMADSSEWETALLCNEVSHWLGACLDQPWWALQGGNALTDHSPKKSEFHYNDVKMSSVASQITTLTIVYSTVYSRADQRKHQSSASLAFVWGIHRWPMNSLHKWPVTRKMFPFDDVIMRGGWVCLVFIIIFAIPFCQFHLKFTRIVALHTSLIL